MTGQQIHLSVDPASIDHQLLDGLVNRLVASRLRSGDDSLWGSEAQEEAKHRLGWINAVNHISSVITAAEKLAQELSGLNYSQIILCGMGGSSLAPQVICQDSPIPLVAVDSTHPDTISELLSEEQLRKSIVIISTKSGGTVETRSQLAMCETQLAAIGINPRDRIVIITDPGSELEAYAQTRQYRMVLGDPDVGGRYSALTAFGLVPASLAGVNLDSFAKDAQSCLSELSEDSELNPALVAATVLAHSNNTRVTAQVTASNSLELLPLWMEQLIAESTGKQGLGLLPLPRKPKHVSAHSGPVIQLSETETPTFRGDNELWVAGSLPAQFLFWEIVTAFLCEMMGVNPFDQPDVEKTKDAVRTLLADTTCLPQTVDIGEGLHLNCTSPDAGEQTIAKLCDELLKHAVEAPYISVQAFSSQPSDLYTDLGIEIERLTHRPVAVSYGPQYLHSTGQLHKGGPMGAVFLQIIELPNTDVQVPHASVSFGELFSSSAIADMKVLKNLGQTGVTIFSDRAESLTALLEELRSR